MNGFTKIRIIKKISTTQRRPEMKNFKKGKSKETSKKNPIFKSSQKVSKSLTPNVTARKALNLAKRITNNWNQCSSPEKSS